MAPLVLRFLAVLLLGASVSGCMSTSTGGTGSIVGAFVSSDEPSMSDEIAQAMAGGLIGRRLGEGLDRSDRQRALEAEYRALEHTASGQAVAWESGRGLSGQVVAAPPYRVGSQNCRQYVHTVSSDGVERADRGTACRNADGSWTPLV